MENKITFNFSESDAAKLLLAAISTHCQFQRLADEAEDENTRHEAENTAATWKRIHDDIATQWSTQCDD